MIKVITALFVFLSALSGAYSWAEPLVVIVNKENPTASLSASEVQRYFLLKSKTWPTGGGKIKPINRNKKSSVKKDFVGSALNMSIQDYQQYWISVKQKSGETEPKTVRSNKFVLKIVGKNKSAVGYIPKKYFDNLEAASKGSVKVVLTIQ